MDIVDKLVDGLCGYKDVLIPASEEIQALRYQLATTRQQLDIAVKALEKIKAKGTWVCSNDGWEVSRADRYEKGEVK